MLSEDVL